MTQLEDRIFYSIENLKQHFIENASSVGTEVLIIKQNTVDKVLGKIIENYKKVITNDETLLKVAEGLNISIYKNKNELFSADAAVGYSDGLIARTGSIVVSSGYGDIAFYAVVPHLIIIAYENQIIANVDKVFDLLNKKYGNLPDKITLITGPSRTADIEKTLILGMHGPKKLTIILIEV